MQCDEKRQICLNYAANVPEWSLALQLNAIKKLNRTAQMCNQLSAIIAGGLSYDRTHPGSYDRSEAPAGFSIICSDTAKALGEGVCAVEDISAQADLFGFTKQLAASAEIAYQTGQLELEDLCRKHGCTEVAYKHG